MPVVKKIAVKESAEELKKLYRKVGYHLKPRIKMLLVSSQKDLHSKQQLSAAIGVDKNSIHNWKTIYAKGGLDALLEDNRGGKRPSVITPVVDQALGKKLAHPTEAPRSFKELQGWVQEHYIAGINYQTLRGYVIRKYGAKLKVVRKTHIHKDEAAVQDFKKK